MTFLRQERRVQRSVKPRPGFRPGGHENARGAADGAPISGEQASDPQRRSRKRRASPRRRFVRVALAFLAAFLILVSWSVGHALTMPGGGTVSDRLAEWARDHYLGPVVTFGEWLTYQPPKVGGKPSFALTGPGAAPATAPKGTHKQRSVVGLLRAAGIAKSLAGKPLRGEGPMAGAGHRPRGARDLRHLPAVQQRVHVLRGRYRLDQPEPGPVPAPPGFRGPGARQRGRPSPRYSRHPHRTARHVQQRVQDRSSGGGFYLNGATSGQLTSGAASVVYYRDGASRSEPGARPCAWARTCWGYGRTCS